MEGPSTQYLYRVDASDKIAFVNSDWLRFAQENEAPELTEDAVVGKPIWHFVTGVETRTLYEALFRSLRSERTEIIVPFRCDSPTIVRHMSLTLRSLDWAAIECEGRLTRMETREPVDLISRGQTRSSASVRICSICRRIEVGAEWEETSSAIVKMRLFGVLPVPRLEETLCPACRLIN